MPDLSAYIGETAEINNRNIQEGGPIFKEPSPRALEFYNSCLITPISGRDALLRTLEIENVVMPFGPGESVLGLFCVDSKYYDFFDDEYDRLVMKQLSDHAFSAVRTLFAAGDLQTSIATTEPERSDTQRSA